MTMAPGGSAMEYEEFINLVEQTVGGDREAAERATHATLQTLGERLGKDEALHLTSHLDPVLGPWLFTAGGAQRMDLDEFLRRVAERERVDRATAERHATAVFHALGHALDDHAYRHLVARLPRTFAPILPRGQYAGDALAAEEFVSKVAGRARLDPFDAQRVAEAVLGTLAQRIGGQATELMVFLPPPLHPALKHGRDNPDPDLTVGEFLARVAQRTHVGLARAREYASAVLAALRETVDSDEFFDTSVQLPGPYWDLVLETR